MAAIAAIKEHAGGVDRGVKIHAVLEGPRTCRAALETFRSRD